MGKIIVDISNRFSEDTENLIVNSDEYEKGLEKWNYQHLVHSIQNNLLLLANENKYMLIKLPINEVPASIIETFYQVQLKGYIPIIENAERNIKFRRNPNILFSLVARGALVQISSSSLTGLNGRTKRKFTLKICKHNLVHLVTLDSLNSDGLPELLKSTYKYLQRKISIDRVKTLQENAKHVMRGTEFSIFPPIKFKKFDFLP